MIWSKQLIVPNNSHNFPSKQFRLNLDRIQSNGVDWPVWKMINHFASISSTKILCSWLRSDFDGGDDSYAIGRNQIPCVWNIDGIGFQLSIDYSFWKRSFNRCVYGHHNTCLEQGSMRVFFYIEDMCQVPSSPSTIPAVQTFPAFRSSLYDGRRRRSSWCEKQLWTPVLILEKEPDTQHRQDALPSMVPNAGLPAHLQHTRYPFFSHIYL